MEQENTRDDPTTNPARALDAERILAQIFTSVKDFAIIVLTPDGRVALWNEGAERLFGYGDRDIMGQPARILFTPEDRDKGMPEQELAKARAEGRADDDCWLQRKDGSRFWASGASSSIRTASGEVEGFIKILRDLTSRKALEDELVRVNVTLEDRIRDRTAELEGALKEMGAFSYSIAHDLKAPLRSMRGFAQLLTQDFGQALGQTGLDYAARISESASFMHQMIEDLLAYSTLTRSEILCHPI